MSASLLSFLFALYAAISPGGTRPRVQPELMSQQEMEVRVRIHASRTLKVAFDDVRVLETIETTWPDERLGCSELALAVDPEPTPGFRVAVKVQAKHTTYHTDRTGRVLKCAAADKKRAAAIARAAPVAPIAPVAPSTAPPVSAP